MGKPLIKLEGVSKRYGAVQALDGLSLEVPEGTVCGLLGPNGSGKTTAIRVLLGLSDATEGRATLLGSSAGDPAFADSLRHTGSLIEGPALYSRATARQNMEIEAAARNIRNPSAQIVDLLTLVGLRDWADKKPRAFSLGMKQRLGLALTLLGDPRLVILDEPTNGLDPAGIAEMRELIKQLPARGVTVLVSSHLLAEVQLMCDRATIIARGKLIADGTMDEILGADRASDGFIVYVPVESTGASVTALQTAGLTAEDRGEGCLAVRGEVSDDSEITRILGESGIWLRALGRERPDLERVFLELTEGTGNAI